MSEAKEYLVTRDAVTAAHVAEMHAWAATSLHVGASPLRGMFDASRGFAITFTHEGLAGIAKRFPVIWPYFELAVLAKPWKPLFGFGERLSLRLARRSVGAFYFNLLSVPAGTGVACHVDATLASLAGAGEVTPHVVSVLYLATPAGGNLRLWRGEKQVADIEPQPGMLVCFRGDLTHEVAAIEVDTAEPRLSLVCEQYAFLRPTILAMPPIKVTSRGLFERILERDASGCA